MERTGVWRLARILKILVTAVFVCNIAALFLVPGLLYLGRGDMPFFLRDWLTKLVTGSYTASSEPIPVLLFGGLFAVWGEPVAAIWTVFLWACGVCTAVILWQARLVLTTILDGNPFQMSNARALKRAAVSCWIVSAAALARLAEWIIREGSLAPLFTYTTLFVPAFFMGGLLFMVMSALFRQAAQLQEDQDLTI